MRCFPDVSLPAALLSFAMFSPIDMQNWKLTNRLQMPFSILDGLVSESIVFIDAAINQDYLYLLTRRFGIRRSHGVLYPVAVLSLRSI